MEAKKTDFESIYWQIQRLKGVRDICSGFFTSESCCYRNMSEVFGVIGDTVGDAIDKIESSADFSEYAECSTGSESE